MTNIGENAFRDCSNLQSITVLATIPPALSYGTSIWVDDYPFINTNNCPIFVPAVSVDAYKEAKGWKNVAYRIKAIP